jgi:hypothetical protein
VKDVTAALKGLVGGLSGTVTVHEAGRGSSTGTDTIGTSSTTTTLDHTVSVTVTNGRAIAKVSYRHEMSQTQFMDYQEHTVTGSRTEVTTSDGSSTNATVTLDLRADGTYRVEFHVVGVNGTWTMEEESRLDCKPNASSCNPYTTKNADSAPQSGLGGASGDGEGRIDPQAPGTLVGQSVRKLDFPDGSGTRTVAWNLSR